MPGKTTCDPLVSIFKETTEMLVPEVRAIDGTADAAPIYQELAATAAGGEHLSYRAWRPRTGTPRGVLVVVPGFKSHSGRYAWAGGELARAGFAVYALDLRGRGHSDGRRFAVGSFSEYVQDVETVVTAVRSKEGDVPLYLLGHSAGAVVAMLYAIDHGQGIAGVVSIGIAQELPAPGFALSAFKVLSRLAPHAPVLRLKSGDFTRDQIMLAEMNADPLIATESEPLQTVAALIRANEALRDQVGLLRAPVLFMHGTADHAARPSGSEHLYAAAGSKDKRLKFYEGMRHEPLADVGREQVLADILQWLDEHLPDTRPQGRRGRDGVVSAASVG
jgi:alpha-beta hydrolase superfamily lysophospholipase